MAWKRARQKFILPTITWRNLQEDGAFQIDFKNLQWTIKWWAFNLGSNCIFLKIFLFFYFQSGFIPSKDEICWFGWESYDWAWQHRCATRLELGQGTVQIYLRGVFIMKELSIQFPALNTIPSPSISWFKQAANEKKYIARKRRHYSEIINWQFF